MALHSSKMRVLMLSDKELSRGLGDGLRVFGLLKHLRARHDFHLACFRSPGAEPDAEVTRLFDSVTIVEPPPPTRYGVLRRLYNAASNRNFKRFSNEMQETIARLIALHRPDLILDVGASALVNLPARECPPLVVDSIDEPLLREQRAMSEGPAAVRFRHACNFWRFWQYERSALAHAVQNIYVSPIDAGVYRRFFPGRPATVIPNGVDIDYFQPVDRDAEPFTIAFEGNMNFAPNIDGAIRLVRDVLPSVRRHVQGARVLLVGRNPAPEVRALAGPNVEVTGSVDDVRAFLARATVFACPMKLGSGIKNKVLQAWAMAKPIVATPESVGGLTAIDGQNILVKELNQPFAEAIVDLLRNPALASNLGGAGRATVVAEYSWQHQAREMERLLQEVLAERSREARPAVGH